jgi:hypothetical protein
LLLLAWQRCSWAAKFTLCRFANYPGPSGP